MSEIVEIALDAADVKTESESVKPEPAACASCVVCGAVAAGAGALPCEVLREYACEELSAAAAACPACLELLQLLEAARLHYLQLREALERLLAPNPRFRVRSATSAAPVAANAPVPFKQEPDDDHDNDAYENAADTMFEEDSDNEPLLLAKKKRHNHKPTKKKKIKYIKTQKKKQIWEVAVNTDEFILPDPGAPPHQVKVEGDSVSQKQKSGEVKRSGDGVKNGRVRRERERERGRGRPRKAEGASPRGPRAVHACDQCNSKFTTLERLTQHARRHLAGRGPFICEVCGAHYKHRRACDIHIAMHRGISDWKCVPCNRLFPSKGALQRHNNIHTGKLNYQCDECGKSFIHTSSFKMHVLTHSGVKPHKCPVCGLGLLTSSHLKRHLRVHSGEKRYACPICGKRYSERYNMIAHSKSHEAVDPPAPAAPPPIAGLPPQRKPFRCAFCPERFPRKYMLERHCGTAHDRAMERAPPRPRNTLSKLLKANAAAKMAAAAVSAEPAVKEDPSPPASSDDTPPASLDDAPVVATAECGSQAALGTWVLPYRN